jgi:hypothetical protein
MDLYDCSYGPVLNIVKKLVSFCMDPLSECVLYGSFENPARVLMRMCVEFLSKNRYKTLYFTETYSDPFEKM